MSAEQKNNTFRLHSVEDFEEVINKHTVLPGGRVNNHYLLQVTTDNDYVGVDVGYLGLFKVIQAVTQTDQSVIIELFMSSKQDMTWIDARTDGCSDEYWEE